MQQKYNVVVADQNVKNIHYQHLLELELDIGEASALALCTELDPALLIIDDLKARKIAHRLGLIYSGTLGLFLQAKERGIITEVNPC